MNNVLPTTRPMTDNELVKLIKAAEKGGFYTAEQIKQQIKEWSKESV